jgi:two-component system response regulator FixJ
MLRSLFMKEIHNSRNICLVEDDQSVRTALRRLFVSSGYSVEAFASPADCLTGFHHPDTWGCLVLDINLPDMTGFELHKELKAYGCLSPLVIITGNDRPATRDAAIQAGAVGYLQKPFDGNELMTIVANALHHAPPCENHTVIAP